MKNENYFRPSITKEDLAILPCGKFTGKVFYIDTQEAFNEYFPYLDELPVLGFDTETKPCFKKGGKNEVALLQLSTSDQAFLFRLNQIGFPPPLVRLLANPEIIKTGVAIRDDLSDLSRLSEFTPQGFIDLQQFVKRFGILDNGLKKLTANILGIRISKRQQTSNWDQKQLTEAQIEYAATDAWVCYQIYSVLKKFEQTDERPT